MVDLRSFKPDLIKFWVEQVRRGDTFAVRALSAEAADCLKSNSELPAPIQEWLADALEAISTGASADRALGVIGKKGPPASKKDMAEISLARDVEHLRRCGRKLTSNRQSLGAYAEVAQMRHTSESKVQRAYQNWKDGVREEEY